VGQPGLGKTYLHEALVREGLALFAVDRDPARLADALRALQPKIVIVDDAQEALDVIQTLRRLRAELDFRFVVHANCWSRSEAEVRAALELPSSSVRTLDLLSREQVLAEIKELGVHGPDQVLHLLLDQAEGKPGLASALVAAVRRGDLERVWSGEAIAESLLHSRQLLKDPHDLPVLASFALGGDPGASISEVSAALGVTPLDVRGTILNLAAGGVVEEVQARGEHRIAIRPLALRAVLVRDAFYKGPGRLDPSGLVGRFRSDPGRIAAVAESLLAARQRGAEIPNDLLLEIAIEADSDSVWRQLGYVDPSLSRAIISHHAEAIPRAADGMLHSIPDEILPHLLHLAASSDQTRRDRVKRAVKSWIEGAEPGDPASVRRRRQLLAAVRAVHAHSKDAEDEHHWALALAISADVDMHLVRPGSGREVTVYFGLRSLEQLRQIAALWPDVVALSERARSLGTDLRSAIDDWCFPGRHAQAGVGPETLEFAKSVGSRMLTDIQRLPACSRACRGWIQQTARRAGLNVTVTVDRLFQRIFESHDHSTDWQTQQRRRELILNAVADQMIAKGPEAAIHELADLEREASSFGWHGGYDRGYLYLRIAQSASNVLTWLRAAVQEALPTEHVHPFVDVALRSDGPELRAALSMLMEPDRRQLYGQTASLAVISLPSASGALVREALDILEVNGHGTTFALVRAAPSESTALQLLQHSTLAIRVHAALAEWLREPKGGVRQALQIPWRAAILEARNEYEHLLGQVLAADDLLAYEWAAHKIAETRAVDAHRFDLWRLNDLFALVLRGLNRDRRWALLEQMSSASLADDIIDTLMQGDSELFTRWLQLHLKSGDGAGRYLALRPLDRDVDAIWERYATAAADEGISPDELADHIHNRSGRVLTGPFSTYYLGLIPTFERLAAHTDARLRVAGRRGLEWARSSAERELRDERREAVRGL
jgi:hypothetical protein